MPPHKKHTFTSPSLRSQTAQNIIGTNNCCIIKISNHRTNYMRKYKIIAINNHEYADLRYSIIIIDVFFSILLDEKRKSQKYQRKGKGM